MRQHFVPQFGQLLKHWLCDMQLGILQKNQALSFDQCWLWASLFLVHLIDLLSILLRCNGLAGIQKVVVNQAADRQTVIMTFIGAGLGQGSALDLLRPASQLVVSSCHIKSTFGHHMSQADLENGSFLLHRIREEDTSK